MTNLALEEIKKQYEGYDRAGVYYWYIPKLARFWEWPRWVEVTNRLVNLSDEQLDRLVQTTPNLHYASTVPLEDHSFDRFLKRKVRRRKLRQKLLAFYRPDRHVGPSFLFDATVFGLVIVLGTANLFV